MALFIDVEVSDAVRKDAELVKKLVEVCPVNIFKEEGGQLSFVEKNLDECVLCELCLNAAPAGSVKVKKLYGKMEVLEKKA